MSTAKQVGHWAGKKLSSAHKKAISVGLKAYHATKGVGKKVANSVTSANNAVKRFDNRLYQATKKVIHKQMKKEEDRQEANRQYIANRKAEKELLIRRIVAKPEGNLTQFDMERAKAVSLKHFNNRKY